MFQQTSEKQRFSPRRSRC